MINRERIYTGGLKFMYRIVMKKDDGNRSSKIFKVSCHTKFRFAERGGGGPLRPCGIEKVACNVKGNGGDVETESACSKYL